MTFSMAQRRLTFTLAAALVAAACGTKDAPDPLSPNGEQGRIRFVNLINDPARLPVNAILEGIPFGVNLTYTQSTPATLPSPATANFSAILAGPRTLVLKKTADTTVVVGTLTITIAAGTDYTFFAYGGNAGSAVSSIAMGDNNPAITNGQVRIKMMNMSAAAGAVDVFITAVNADLAAATPAAANLAYKAEFPGTLLAAGTYQVRTVPAGTAPAARSGAVSSTISVTVPANGGRTIVLADAPAGGGPVRSFALTDQ
jgi:hypothetical protein